MTNKSKFKLIKILLLSILFIFTCYTIYNQFFISDCKKVSVVEKQILNNKAQYVTDIDDIKDRYKILGVENQKIVDATLKILIVDENDEAMMKVLLEEEKLSTNLVSLNNTKVKGHCEKKLKTIEKLKTIKSQKNDLMKKRFDDELSLALKYQYAPKDLIDIFDTLKDTGSIKYSTPTVVGLLLNKLLNYKLDPDIADVLKFEIENSAFLLLENKIQKPKDYYLILKNMLTIDKNGCMCLEVYKDDNGRVLTRDIQKNPNYILDNEKKIREWLLESQKNQKRLGSILSEKGIHSQDDWYINQE